MLIGSIDSPLLSVAQNSSTDKVAPSWLLICCKMKTTVINIAFDKRKNRQTLFLKNKQNKNLPRDILS